MSGRTIFIILFLTLSSVTSSSSTSTTSTLILSEEETLNLEGEKLFQVFIPKESCADLPIIVAVTTTGQNLNGDVEFMAFQGRNFETWTLASDKTNSATIRLCVECQSTNTLDDNPLYIFIKSTVKSKVNIVAFIDVINFEENVSVTSTLTIAAPMTFLVDKEKLTDHDRLIMDIDNVNNDTKDVCMMVSVQPRRCPLKNRVETVNSAKMFASILEKGTLIIDVSKFNLGQSFFVSMFLLANDSRCRSDEIHSTITADTKDITIRFTKSNENYTKPIGLLFGAVIGVSILGLIPFGLKFCFPNWRQFVCKCAIENSEGEMLEKDEVDGNEDQHGEIIPTYLSKYTNKDEISKSNVTNKEGLKERIALSMNRLKKKSKFSDMSTIVADQTWYRRNRSRTFYYLIPIMSIYYFVPAFQFAFLDKNNEVKFGDQDICYHNFRCSRPFGKFSDFNHVISNACYMIYGLVFCCIVKCKTKWLTKFYAPKENDSNSELNQNETEMKPLRSNQPTTPPLYPVSPLMNHQNDAEANLNQNGFAGRRSSSGNEARDIELPIGAMHQFGIFYALGFALILQGLFSICYHVCPTNYTLQFDTTIMYLICTLSLVKIYQFRHPDAIPTALTVFMFVGALVLIEALVIHFRQSWVFITFIVLYILLTIFLAYDCYFIGVGRLGLKMALKIVKKHGLNLFKNTKFRKKRLLFSVLLAVLNFGLAAFIIYEKFKDPDKTVSHSILLILATNLVVYLIVFVVAKKVFYKGKLCPSKCSRSIISNKFVKISGPIFTIATVACVYYAQKFYLSRTADRNLAAAESRNLNMECAYLDFYDSHDMWHFLSATGIFFAFLALLTIDDDLIDTPRDQIDVY